MPNKKKNKKAKAKKKIKKAKAGKKQRKILGRKIKVKEVIEPKSENIYGCILEPDQAEDEKVIIPEFAWADFDFYEEKPEEESDADLNEIAELAQEINYNDKKEEFVPTDYGQPVEQFSQEEFKEPESMESLSSRQKIIIMYVSLVFVMGVIIGFWFLNMKASLSQNLKNVNLHIESNDQIGQSIDEFSQGLADLQTQLENQKDTVTDFTDQAKAKIIEQQLKNSVTNTMKEKLENLNVNSTNTNSL